jgi:hypothetical protein
MGDLAAAAGFGDNSRFGRWLMANPVGLAESRYPASASQPPVILSMDSRKRLPVMAETGTSQTCVALSPGERVARDRRFHQPARAG